ncbi:MAG TPA: type II secretion system F family protein [Lachnospiraceae bacterium]|nr:type II secretion system F family protein [Lachnospiraceae bacterium]
MSLKEKTSLLIQGGFIIGSIGYLFYESIIAVICLLPLFIVYIKRKKRELIIKQRQELVLQFRDTIIYISSSLQAGYSMENALKQSYIDMCMIYGKETMMTKELYYMNHSLLNSVTIEKLLDDFGKRSKIEEIQEFADIFMIAKRNGGDLNEIIRNCIETIGDKIDVKREIYTSISAKKYESKIMNCIPFFIILYISISSPGFFHCLYHNVVGITIMTACLLVYLIAYNMSQKIVSIEV